MANGETKNAGTSVECNYTNLGVYGGTSTAITAQWTIVCGNNAIADGDQCVCKSGYTAMDSEGNCYVNLNCATGATQVKNTCVCSDNSKSYAYGLKKCVTQNIATLDNNMLNACKGSDYKYAPTIDANGNFQGKCTLANGNIINSSDTIQATIVAACANWNADSGICWVCDNADYRFYQGQCTLESEIGCTNSTYNEETGNCDCNEGFVPSSEPKSCVLCSQLHTNSEYDTATKSCKCASGYQDIDDSDDLQCVANVIKLDLDAREGTLGIEKAIYQRYNVGFFLDEAATTKQIGVQTCTECNKLTVPTRQGHKFNGYYNQINDGKQIIDENGYVVSNSLATTFTVTGTLFAQWTPNTYTIAFDANKPNAASSDVSGTMANISMTYDVAKNLATNTYKLTGWTFAGWLGSDGKTYANGQSVKNLTAQNGEEVTMKAQWTPNTYTVSYAGNGNTAGLAPTAPVSCTYDSDCVAPNNTYVKTGYVFAGWKCTGGTTACDGDIIGEGASLKNVSTGAPITLTAQWGQNAYMIAFNANKPENATSNIKGIMQNMPMVYDVEQNLNRNAYELTGWTFAGWLGSDGKTYTDGQLVKNLATQSDETITMKAQWTPNTYTIAFDANKPENATSNVTGLMQVLPMTYDVAKNLGANLYKLTGWTFTGWLGSDGKTYTNDQSVKNLTAQNGEKVTMKAQWVPNTYNVTLNKNGGTGDTETIRCTFDSMSCALPAIDFERTGYVSANKWCTMTNGNGTCFEPGVSTNFSNTASNVTLYAAWTPGVFKVELRASDATENANQGPVYLKYANGWYSDANATQELTSIGADLPEKFGTSYIFAGYELNGVKIVNEDGLLNTATDALKVTSKPAIAKAMWINGTTKCQDGYYYPGMGVQCTVCPKDNWCPAGAYLTDSYTVGGLNKCPNGGKTLGTGNASATACYLEKLACNVENGAGERTCFYNTGAKEYIAQCSTCIVTTCNSGSSQVGNTCEVHKEDAVYKDNDVFTCAELTGGRYPNADAGTKDEANCFRNCALQANAFEMNGRDYFGIKDTCEIVLCNDGYTLENGVCVLCPTGSVCKPDNAKPQSCASLTNGEYPLSKDGSDNIEDCFKICPEFEVEYGTAKATAFYPNACEYKCVSETGNPGKIVDNKCVETSCNYNFERVNGVCQPCNRKNALSYKKTGNCVVDSCEKGFHPNAQECVADVRSCNIKNAEAAEQVWDATKNAFTECRITKCKEGYHIDQNVCQPNTKSCEVENGVGTRKWDDTKKTWGECIATKCNPGYTNNDALTDEPWKQCGRCDNMYGAFGDLAASSYVRECEIATCMYQGEKYVLENNECRLICTESSDFTGTRYWNDKTKRCEHNCNPGYMSW